MAIIRIRRSNTPGNVPASLQPGELAINQADGLLYWSDGNGVIQSTPMYGAPMDAMRSNSLVVNGGMQVSQRFGSTIQNLTTGTPAYITDTFLTSFVRSGATFTGYQNIGGAPIGFNNYLGMKVGTVISSYSAGDYALMQTKIEGYRWSLLAYGTSAAMPCTVGFWVFATVSGTACFSIRNDAGNRSYVQEFSVVGNQWTFVLLNIPGDVTGTWQNLISTGANITWCFGSGTTLGSATNKAWTATNQMATTNTSNFFGTTNNIVGLTGVFIVPGTYLIPSTRSLQLIQPYPRALDECLRYYETGPEPLSYRNSPTSGITIAYDTIRFVKPKRAAPSISFTNWQYYSGGTPAALIPVSNTVDTTRFEVLGTGLTNWMGWYNSGTWTANASL